jgi:MFS family permease
MGEVVEKTESSYRWVILFLTCVMMIGNYYSYDNPAALKTQIDDYMGNPDDFETLYNLLYTVYSIPNVFLPFVGGYFVDSWGVRICLIIFCCLIFAGQAIFALGLSLKSWPLMYVGRIIFGMGGESLSVGNSALLSAWFEGKELAFAFGLNLSIARLGSVINNLVSPAIANGVGLVYALWFSAILCGVSVLCSLIIQRIDKRFDDSKNKGTAKLILDGDDISNPLIADDNDDSGYSGHDIDSRKEKTENNEEEVDKVEFWEIKKFNEGFWLLVISCLVVYGCVLPFNNIASSLLLERDFFMTPPDSCVLIPDACQTFPADSTSVEGVPTNCPSSTNYQPPLPTNCTVPYPDGDLYNPLDTDDIDCTSDDWSGNDACTYVFCDRQDSATVTATTVMSIPYIISAICSPFLGKVVDNYGYRALIATCAPFLLIWVHLSLAITTITPEIPLAGQGLSYSAFAAVLWPSIPLVVEKRLIGLAYGVCTSVQNIGLATFPLIVATIYESSGGKYLPNVEFFFMSLAVGGFVVGVYMNYYDATHDNIFNRVKPPEDEFDAIGDISTSSRDEPYRKLSTGSFSQPEEVYAAKSGKKHQ